MAKKCCICGEDEHHVNLLFKGKDDAYICDACIDRCTKALEKTRADGRASLSKSITEGGKLMTPAQIKARLDEYIIGQDDAKKTISVAVYNHYKRVNGSRAKIPVKGLSDNTKIQKSNVLLVGPTGSGKTLIAQTIAKTLDVPFAIADATSLTEAGYVGDDVESILLKLIQAADGDVEKAEKGIVYIDEIDKISASGKNRSLMKDVSGEGVQNALLKIIEGTVSEVPKHSGRKTPFEECYQINTKDILFICGGAFRGIEELIHERTDDKTSIGFGAVVDNRARKERERIAEVTTKDLREYGMTSEFLGRMPIIATLEKLDEKALVSILTEPKDALIDQYRYLMAMDGIELKFERGALEAIAKEAISNETGARGLRTILERIMRDPMYEIPSKDSVISCTITKRCVTDGAKPKISSAELKEPVAV